MFGKPPFGSTNPTFGTTSTSLFGNKPAFGSTTTTQQPTQQTSLFGSKPGGLFGSSTTTQGTSLFGSSQPAPQASTSLFGASKPSLFGASTQQPATNTFGGSSTSTSLFGSPSTGTSGGLFGSSAQQPTLNGTTQRFEPLISSDTMIKNNATQSISTKHMCITAMKCYENKSLEELRVEDYLANRKAPAAGSTTAFGSTTTGTSGGLFGSQPAAAGTSMFGSTANKPLFGSSTTQSAFGTPAQPQQQTTSLFGSPSTSTANTGMFGAKPTTLFGGATTTTFGSAPTQPAGGSLFGGTSNTSFGTTTQQPTTNLFGGGTTFGQPAASQSSFFGGASTAPTFGQAAPGGSLFGAQPAASTSTSLFGAKPATSAFSFNTPASTAQPFGSTTGGGLFGGATNKPLFGSTSTSGGLFGATTTQPANSFGQPAQPAATGTIFGQQPAQPSFGAVPQANVGTGGVVISLSDAAAQKVIEQNFLESQVSKSPYATSLLTLKPQIAAPAKTPEDSPQTATQRRFLRTIGAAVTTTTTSTATITTSSISTVNTSLVAGSTTSSTSSPASLPVPGAKVLDVSRGATKLRSTSAVAQDLNYTRSVAPPTLGRGLRQGPPAMLNSPLHDSSLGNHSTSARAIDQLFDSSATLNGTRNVLGASALRRNTNVKHLDMNVVDELERSSRSAMGNRSERDPDELPLRPRVESSTESQVDSPAENPLEAARTRETHLRQRQPPQLNLDATVDTTIPTPQRGSPRRQEEERENRRVVTSPASRPTPAGVKVVASDYYVEPPIEAMHDLIDAEGYIVLPNGLTIGRATYGSVFWPGPLRLKNLALDDVVVFRHKEVTVYPKESEKPPIGEGLNRPAEVTLERVWPLDKSTKEPIKDPLQLVDMGFRERLERVCARQQAIFKDYRPNTGSWVFKVEHFSKYGLPDEDDDEEMAADDEMQRSMHEAEVQAHVQRAKIALQPPLASETQIEEAVGEDIVRSRRGHLETLMTEEEDEPDRGSHIGLGGALGGLGGIRSFHGLGGNLYGGVDTLSHLLEEPGYARQFRPLSDEDMDVLSEGDGLLPEKRIKMDIDELEDESEFYEKSLQQLDLIRRTRHYSSKKPLVLNCDKSRELWTSLPVKTVTRPERSFIDVARGHGNGTRLGWAPGGVYALCHQPADFTITVHRFEYPEHINVNYLSDLFEHNIRHVQRVARNESGHSLMAVIPLVKPPQKGQAILLEAFVASARQHDQLEDLRVWQLCQALFTEQQYDDGSPRSVEDLLGEWLREAVAASVRRRPRPQRGTDAILHAISRGDSEAASTAALDAGLNHLSMALSFFPMDDPSNASRQDFEAQVALWEQNQTTKVDEPLVKACVIMARRTFAERQRGGRVERVNALEGLDWMQALGVLIWWHGLSLKRALEVLKNEEEAGRLVVDEDDPDLWHGKCVEAELIRLAANRSHQIERILDAGDRTMDHSLSWHLWTVLRATGYSHMDASKEQTLHGAYAEQLAGLELTHLALFTLAHISNNNGRTTAMKDLLEHEARTLADDELEKIVEICEVPPTWVASAKLARAVALEGDKDRICELALEAEEYDLGLRTFVEHVAPNAVVLAEFDRLQRFAEAFLAVSEKIPGWGAQGQLFVDYLELKSLKMRDEQEDDDAEERFRDVVHSIKSRINGSEFKTPLQRLAIQTIAHELYEIELQMTGEKDFDLPLTVQQINSLELQSHRITSTARR